MNTKKVTKSTTTSGKKNSPQTKASVRERWKALIRLIIENNKLKRKHKLSITEHRVFLDTNEQTDLINEIKRSKRNKVAEGDVFSILKSQASLTEKVFARQKYSAKEVLIRRTIHQESVGKQVILDGEHVDLAGLAPSLYDYRIQQRYPITPEIQTKLDKIREKKERDEKKGKSIWTQLFEKFLGLTILGQTFLANPTFCSLDPLEHLPPLCRRCRRPLRYTLIRKFSPAGMIFALLIPLLGILLLFANQEFYCVVCNEMYVYGDLTSRPNEYNEGDESK